MPYWRVEAVKNMPKSPEGVNAMRAKVELSKAIAISRKQFESGECLTEENSFDAVEKMLGEMNVVETSR